MSEWQKKIKPIGENPIKECSEISHKNLVRDDSTSSCRCLFFPGEDIFVVRKSD